MVDERHDNQPVGFYLNPPQVDNVGLADVPALVDDDEEEIAGDVQQKYYIKSSNNNMQISQWKNKK